MKVANFKPFDVSNWDGINASIFFSGCNFNCPGCFNKEAQDFDYGEEFTKEFQDVFIRHANNPDIAGVCILGGEPFQQNHEQLYEFIKRLYFEVKKPIHMWTGYKYEDLIKSREHFNILYLIDTLVDGQFDMSKKDLRLKYRGSSNQRVIDIRRTIHYDNIVLVENNYTRFYDNHARK